MRVRVQVSEHVHEYREVPDIAPTPFLQERGQGLGDMVESALSAIGVTKDRVSRWLGMPCNCERRKEKLNALGRWAKRVLTGRKEDAAKYLDQLTDGE